MAAKWQQFTGSNYTAPFLQLDGSKQQEKGGHGTSSHKQIWIYGVPD
jgi:hypothetical protein